MQKRGMKVAPRCPLLFWWFPVLHQLFFTACEHWTDCWGGLYLVSLKFESWIVMLRAHHSTCKDGIIFPQAFYFTFTATQVHPPFYCALPPFLTVLGQLLTDGSQHWHSKFKFSLLSKSCRPIVHPFPCHTSISYLYPLIPCLFSFLKSFWSGTLSNTFWKL